ncbi:hypothetical protein D0T50_12135 [Bacteroides sp. 214]|uniref:rhamnogalacturonan acetylesterase n=1 Tax=Bacteroides sp. 214 TaxID=2302935 RepID=UPI0013D3BB82|nr:rhamnogalacturonan acetylesterase [Bacteroides sp. 214]NDW13633.1 hypothetical protein [Bacteroides sp. 214]
MKKLLFTFVAFFILSGCHAQVLRVHTIGDSTMADYMENTTRTRGWGEMLQEFFSPEVQVMNYARGGRSSRSFHHEGRWDMVKENLKPGDYVFIQFAHNDEHAGGKDGADFRGTEPWTTYKRFIELYVDETRQLGGYPILITPIIRRYFDADGKISPKGCHDIGIAPDDSTLNYVRVMKHIAREKKVAMVDITALTKAYVEELGAENTIKQIYVPTDGTHTQATGAAIYAKLVADDLKRQGILAKYILDPAIVLNPTSLNFQTVYVNDDATICFDLTALKLSPENGILRLQAPVGMFLSDSPKGEHKTVLELPYSNGKLWNQCCYLHFTPVKDEVVDTAIRISYGDQIRLLPIQAICKTISQKKDVELTKNRVAMRGLVKIDGGITLETGTWVAEIDEDGNRYVELVVTNHEKTLVVQELSLTLVGKVSYRIAYAFGKDFYPRTDIGEGTQSGNLVFPINTTLNPGKQLHIRFFPWSTSGGDVVFELKNCSIKGMEIE